MSKSHKKMLKLPVIILSLNQNVNFYGALCAGFSILWSIMP